MSDTEIRLMAWFAAHPFTRTVTLMALTAIVVKIKQDFEDYRKALADNPYTPYLVWEMIKKCAWGTVTAGVLAIVPTVWAEIIKILGGGVLPTP